MMWRRLVVLLLAIVLGSASPQAAPGDSRDITPALAEANKVMQKGGYAKAIEMIDEALRAGGSKVPSELAAKALLMRGEANEKLARVAYAYADYNSAIWMQGLSAADRKRAEEGQARVSKGLGVAALNGGSAPAAPATTASTEPAAGTQPPAQSASASSAQKAPPEQRAGNTGGIDKFFNNLFGGSSSQQQPPPAAEPLPSAAVASTEPAAGGQPPAQSASASSAQKAPPEQRAGNTGGIGKFFNNLFSGSSQQQPEPLPSAAVAVTAPPPEPAPAPKTPQKKAASRQQPEWAPGARPAPPPAASSKQAAATPGSVKRREKGNYVLQLAAAVPEEDRAIAEADRLAKRYSADLGGRAPSLMIVPTADGGTLYKVVLGPFETRGEGAATCETLKVKGMSCMVITKK